MRDPHRKSAGPGRLLRRCLVFACLASLVLSARGEAATILVYGQQLGPNTVTLNNNGAGVETLTSINTQVLVTTIAGVTVNAPAVLNLNAMNVGPANGPDASGNISESFHGTFSIMAPGVNILSGTFTDTFGGKLGGSAANLGVAQPPDQLVLTSDIPEVQALFNNPLALSIAFTNLSQPLVIVNGSIGALGDTTMQQAGNVSGNLAAVPEPSTLLVGSITGLGLIGYGLRRRRTTGD